MFGFWSENNNSNNNNIINNKGLKEGVPPSLKHRRRSSASASVRSEVSESNSEPSNKKVNVNEWRYWAEAIK